MRPQLFISRPSDILPLECQSRLPFSADLVVFLPARHDLCGPVQQARLQHHQVSVSARGAAAISTAQRLAQARGEADWQEGSEKIRAKVMWKQHAS